MSELIQQHCDAQGICTVSLNRPDTHNAFNDELIAKLTQTWQAIANDDNIRVVILKGNGKSFCAGADLHWMQNSINYTQQQNIDDAMGLATMLNSLNSLPQATIALVHGAAFGGGVGLLACCDIILATPAAKFCFSEVKLGLIPAVISPYVVAHIGHKAARRYFLSAERFSAEQALQLNLIDEIVDAEQLPARANQFAQQFCQNSPAAIAQCKALLQAIQHQPLDDKLLLDTAQRIAHARQSEQGQEGLRAFFAKQPPAWIKQHD